MDKEEREIILVRNLDLGKSPFNAIGKVVDITLEDGKTYRTMITDYDPSTKLHTIDPTNWDTWPPDFDTEVNLMTIGLPDSLEIVPKIYALHFEPLLTTENLGKKYAANGKLKTVDSLVVLSNDIKRGKVCSCAHNGRVARRYVSANKRESNAVRYGVT